LLLCGPLRLKEKQKGRGKQKLQSTHRDHEGSWLALAGDDLHGYAILKEVELRTGGKVRLSTGTLYGIIKR